MAIKSEEKKPFHEVVAEKLIEQLKAGTAPWQKPWTPGESNSVMPTNPTTGNRYKGINAIHLMNQGREDTRWMTYKQASDTGAQVRKGEKGTSIQYWKFSEERNKLDDQGKPIHDAKGEKVKETIKLERPRVFFATVFNGDQIDGLPPQERKPQTQEQKWEAIEQAENILNASGAKITNTPSNRAFYRPSTDSITMPEKSQFESADRYYATALHELGHWTGHASRLNREDLGHPFGSEKYAKEELRAEISSMILGDTLGIGHDPEQHAAYVQSWVKALENDSLEIFRAASDAEKIHDYVMAFEQKQEQKQEQAVEQPLEPVQENVPAQTQKQAEEQTPEPKLASHVASQNQAQTQEASINTPHQVNEEKPNQQTSDGDDNENEKPKQEKTAREFINVPFKEKDEAKEYGARWDRQEKSWYVPPGVDTEPFAKWTQNTPSETTAAPVQTEEKKTDLQTRTYLAVPYVERGEAKEAGAQWDKSAKSWFADENADMAKLARWMPENVSNEQGPAMTPREEFAEAMKSAGLLVGNNAQGSHPIMDGQKHRVPVEGGKSGAKDGFYVGYLDGRPAGRIINNKTGTDIKWKSKGYVLDDKEKAKLHAEAATKLASRAAEQVQKQEAVSQTITRQTDNLLPIQQPTPYLEAKGIQAHAGALTDNDGQKTFIPAFDTEGKQWTMQYIQEDGTKRFAKDGKKEGCFHPVGGMDALANAPVLVIAEGYATAASVSEALGHATVAAFDAGNLPTVAKALHQKYPDKPIVIAGDDDKQQEIERGKNPGRAKAEEAAQAVGGKAIYPIFAPNEQQKNPKQFSDFNDLASKSTLGPEGVRRQVVSAVAKVLQESMQQHKVQKQSRQLEQKREHRQVLSRRV